MRAKNLVLVLIDDETIDELALDMPRLERELEDAGTIVERVESYRNSDVAEVIENSNARRLALAGPANESYPKIQALARKYDIDPLGIQIVDLAAYCPADAATDYAILLLRAAVARSRSYPGSRLENVKMRNVTRSSLSRRDFFSPAAIEYLAVPSIDHDKCMSCQGCDLCLRNCPHEALYKRQNAVVLDRGICTGCGVCVSNCPWQAIDFPHWSYEEIAVHVSMVARSRQPLLFVCHNADVTRGNGWVPVSIPCQGFITVALLLQALAHGAPAVSVCSCGELCTTRRSEEVASKVDFCRNFLQQLGESEARVELLSFTREIPPPPSFAPLNITNDAPLPSFGAEAAEKIIRSFAASYERRDLYFEHPASPLGTVAIDPQVCTGCSTCTQVCPSQALCYRSNCEEIAIEFDPTHCLGCGHCELVYPERQGKAITMEQKIDMSNLDTGKQSLYRDQKVLCSRCGAAFATKRMVERIATLLGDDFSSPMATLCSDCRGLGPGFLSS